MTKMHVKAEQIHKSFGAKHVLRGLDVNIDHGESLVVIGGSGSGKTVLLRALCGLHGVSSGSVTIDGKSLPKLYSKSHASFMRKVGVLFQAGALFDSLPIWHNIAFSGLQHGDITKKEALLLAEKKLEEVGLSGDILFASPSELSGGMQKRVALARAIAFDPELIFFDEPTTGLDPIMSDVINRLIVECRDKLGATTFTITHDMRSAFMIADRVAMLHEGTIRWQGKPDDISNAEDSYLQDFVRAADHTITKHTA